MGLANIFDGGVTNIFGGWSGKTHFQGKVTKNFLAQWGGKHFRGGLADNFCGQVAKIFWERSGKKFLVGW